MKRSFRSLISVALTAVLILTAASSVPVQALGDNPFSSFTEKAKELGNDAVDAAKSAGESAKDKASSAAGTVKDKADEAAAKAGEAAEQASSAVRETQEEASAYAEKVLADLSDKAEDAADTISKTAAEAKDAATSGMAMAAGSITAAAESVDTDQIEKGWEYAAELTATSTALMSASEYNTYIKSIADEIETMRVDLNNSANNGRGVGQEKGFVFEKWQADTYNIDAVSKELDDRAWRLESNADGSVDVQTSAGEAASGKAYKNGAASAKQQAERSGNKTLLKGYQEMNHELEAQGKEPISIQDYVDNNLSEEEIEELFSAKYEGQTRLIPSDQMDDAVAYLQGEIDKLPEDSKMSAADAKRYKETMESLRDHIGDENGAQSKPLTSEELQALTEMANEGDVDLDQFGIKVSNYISRADLVNEVMSAGASAAVLQIALTVGPDVYKIIVDSLESGEIDKAQLKQLGLDAALAGAGGFAEGSISETILIACKAGKFGNQMKDVSPNTVGAIAVLTVDAAKYAYMLYNNQITPTDYANLMAEETFVLVVSQASGTALQLMLPMVPFAYLAGSMAGGMLASAGYELAEDMVVEIKNEGGISAVMPEEVTEGATVGKEAISELITGTITPDLADVKLVATAAKKIRISKTA